MVSFWENVNATTRASWFRTLSIGLGVLGIGLLIGLIGFVFFLKK